MGRVYPGTYSLRVVALDAASGKVGTREFAFAVYPSSLPAFRLSDIVVASRCLDEAKCREEQTCLIRCCWMDASSLLRLREASATESPTMLVRLYTTDQELRATFLKQWKAYVAIGDGPRIPLPIESADIRGLIATGKLDLAKLGAKQGANPIVVMFEAPAAHGKMHAVALQRQLTLIP